MWSNSHLLGEPLDEFHGLEESNWFKWRMKTRFLLHREEAATLFSGFKAVAILDCKNHKIYFVATMSHFKY
jgi:hypothetical protein